MEKAEEPKYNDRSVEINRTKQPYYNENKTENQREQQDIKNENCMKCDKFVETAVQCGYRQRLFHFKCEGTTKEKVMQDTQEKCNILVRRTRSTKKRESAKVNTKQQ